MIGYNLYLTDNHPDFPYDSDPLFLRLSYDDLNKALEVKKKLEEIYGENTIEIVTKTSELDAASQVYYQE